MPRTVLGRMMIRCCLCRRAHTLEGAIRAHVGYEPTGLPGTGWRCIDHTACRERVQAVIAAHQGLAEACE